LIPGDEAYREHADFRARMSASGIGAAAVRSEFKDDRHVWECIVSDGRDWEYLTVIGEDLGPFPSVSAEDVERGVERFAGALPPAYRLRAVLNANPLHVDSHGVVSD
jgi:hypothetical protein